MVTQGNAGKRLASKLRKAVRCAGERRAARATAAEKTSW
jgi:hypothetical protein